MNWQQQIGDSTLAEIGASVIITALIIAVYFYLLISAHKTQFKNKKR